MRTIIIDNYDSFTYNLYQLIATVSSVTPIVIRHDECSYEVLQHIPADNIVISPGPGHPQNLHDFGICQRVIQESPLPVLGICLGHQGLCTAFGGQVVLAPEPIHGQVSLIKHRGHPLFANIPSSFHAVRYHSLIADNPLPAELEVLASTEDGLIMALAHRVRPLFGVQYHPESICSEYGAELFKNFNALTQLHQKEPMRYISDINTNTYALEVKKYDGLNDSEAIFEHLFASEQEAVWLDSTNRARFSIMGCLDGPLSYRVDYDARTKTITKKQGSEETSLQMSLFDFLNQALKEYAISTPDDFLPFCCGFIGYFGYELLQETLLIEACHPSPYPDARFLFLDRALVFSHEENRCYLLALCKENDVTSASAWFEEKTALLDALPLQKTVPEAQMHPAIPFKAALRSPKSEYLRQIDACLKAIQAGESYEICLTNRLDIDAHVEPFSYYQALRRINPAPYAAFMRFHDFAIASSSVERFLHIDTQRQVEAKPIKGTLHRGQTPEEDRQLRDLLQQDVKYRAENLMIVDLLRHDLGQVCEVGSVQVTKLMDVESYPHVHQLVSTIRGQLRQDKTPIDCIIAAFPGGSMTGAPKVRTVAFLQELEGEARGIYSGSIGYLSLNDTVDLNIVIRTAIIKPGQLHIGIGGAITALSHREEEFDEILLKATALQRALAKMIITHQAASNTSE